jgi:hypothetical protein
MKEGASDLVARLRQIETLVAACLRDTSTGPVLRRSVGKSTDLRRPHANSLSTRILSLKDGGFFRQARTAANVHEKLQASYECELNRVAVVLRRMSKKRQLRKTSKNIGKAKQVAYVW